MEAVNEKNAEEATSTEKKPSKPCPACPETKLVRDACIMENGQENCIELIEAHKKCMRDLGLNI
jgi:cytochrome c oxidase assembly protein subunit 17